MSNVRATITKALRELERGRHPAAMTPSSQRRFVAAAKQKREKKSIMDMSDAESMPGRLLYAHIGAGGLGAGIAIREKQRKSRKK